MYEYRKYESRQEMFGNFGQWLDNALDSGDFPKGTAAAVFNLYEDKIGKLWSTELVGTEDFDPDNEDWRCGETADLGTRDAPFGWEEETGWESILSEAKEMVTDYLKSGKHAERLRSYAGIGIGFVEGDCEIVYCRKQFSGHAT